MRGMITALLAGLLVAVFALPAGAVPPERDSVTYEWPDIYAACDSFDVVTDNVLTFEATDFVNGNGEWVRTDLHGKLVAMVYRSDGTGPMLQEKLAFRNVYTLDEPDGYGVGLGWNLKVPGHGWVYKLTGVYSWDPITGIDYEATGLNVNPYDHGVTPEAQAALCGYFGNV